MKKDRLEILVSIFVLLIVSGVIYFLVQNYSKGETADSKITYETISVSSNLKLGISEYDTINPYSTKNRDILYLDKLIFEPLLNLTSDYHTENCLASEVSQIKDKTYIIKLKENILWSNGTSLSSKDVDYSINEIKQNKDSAYYENVKDIEKVELIDAYTIRIELNKEVPFFEYNLIFPILSASQEEILIGTGRYKIEEIDEEKIKLVLNENFRLENANSTDENFENKNFINKGFINSKANTEEVNTTEVTVLLYDTMGEVYNAFKEGKIDFINTENESVEEYIGSMGYAKETYSGREYDYIAFNLENTILKNLEVRQAIALSIQQERIVNSILNGKAYTAYFPLEEQNYLLRSLDYEHNVEKAKKVLDEAGWSYENGNWQKQIDGKIQKLDIKLSVNKNDENRLEVAKEISAELQEAGINLIVEEISETQYKNYLKNHNYEILLTGVYSSYSPDVTYFFGENNLANYKSKEMTKILEQLKSIKSEDLIKEKYGEIFEIYNEDIPYIGLYRNQNVIAHSTNFRGEIIVNNYSIYYKLHEWYIQS